MRQNSILYHSPRANLQPRFDLAESLAGTKEAINNVEIWVLDNASDDDTFGL